MFQGGQLSNPDILVQMLLQQNVRNNANASQQIMHQNNALGYQTFNQMQTHQQQKQGEEPRAQQWHRRQQQQHPSSRRIQTTSSTSI